MENEYKELRGISYDAFLQESTLTLNKAGNIKDIISTPKLKNTQIDEIISSALTPAPINSFERIKRSPAQDEMVEEWVAEYLTTQAIRVFRSVESFTTTISQIQLSKYDGKYWREKLDEIRKIRSNDIVLVLKVAKQKLSKSLSAPEQLVLAVGLTENERELYLDFVGKKKMKAQAEAKLRESTAYFDMSKFERSRALEEISKTYGYKVPKDQLKLFSILEAEEGEIGPSLMSMIMKTSVAKDKTSKRQEKAEAIRTWKQTEVEKYRENPTTYELPFNLKLL